MNRAEMT